MADVQHPNFLEIMLNTCKYHKQKQRLAECSFKK